MNGIWLLIILLFGCNNFGGRDCDDCEKRCDNDCDRKCGERERDCDRRRDNDCDRKCDDDFKGRSNDCDDCGRRFENERRERFEGDRRERFEGERRERCDDDFRGRSSIPSPRSMPCPNFPGMCGCEEKGNLQEK